MSDNLSHKEMSLPAIAEAQAGFALDLLRDNGFNNSAILSPISISIALAMVYLGAKENTANQIRDTIAKGASEKDIHAHFSSVLNLINSNDLNVTLETANRVYLKKDFKLLDSYIEGIKKHYSGELEEIDFTAAADAANKINGFVSNATHDKIKDLVKADSFNDLTRLVLINAIYFKGLWDKPFIKDITVDADFHSSPDSTKKVKMMIKYNTEFPYFENDQYQVLGLPYQGELVTMYIILPRERFGLENVVKNMNASTLAQILAIKDHSEVDIQLPKFKIESEFQLADALQKLGIVDAFGDKANFSGISTEDKLQVSKVIHKAFIETDEEGTVAAAATGIEMMLMSAPALPKKFTADHPFIFVIADNQQNIHFCGIHVDP